MRMRRRRRRKGSEKRVISKSVAQRDDKHCHS